jgi:alkylation response protein AidB-like acyl-CoA dehydrogenase
MSNNFFKDNEDLQFYFERGIDWDAVVSACEHGMNAEGAFANTAEAVEFYRGIAELVGEFVATEVVPRSKAIEKAGNHLENGEAVVAPEQDELFELIRGLELHGMCLPRELGGMNAPTLSYMINTELFARADVSVMAHYSFHGGIALSLLAYSLAEGTTTLENGKIVATRFAKEIEEIREGKAWGCMDITEPDAGSDMARLKAFGEQDAEGNWFVTGEKIFITSGHGKYHLVIARTEKAQSGDDPMVGLKGLSMFLVEAYEEDADGNRQRSAVTLTRVEEKLGHHGSVTAALAFERAPARLIGNRGEGFKHMLSLMNGARLGVGFESIGLCEAAYRLAKQYASERPSMGKSIDRHEMIADYLEEMQTDIQGMRAIAMRAAVAEELSRKLAIRLGSDTSLAAEEREELSRTVKRSSRVARRLTPLLKYFAAERAVEHARRCLQLHGGNGYTTEYGAEKLLRDALVMPIYEGTSQIQSLMAMKDTLGVVMKNPQAFVKRMAQARWRSISAPDALERRVAKVHLLSLTAQNHLITKTATDKVKSLTGRPLGEWPDAFLKNWNPKRDFAYAMLHAERLTKLLIDEAIAETLLEQALAHPERRDVLERWLDRCEPRARFLHDEITTTGDRILQKLGNDTAKQAPSQAAE